MSSNFRFIGEKPGAVGVNANRAVDYHIYVHKKDYDAAVQCMRQC